MFWEILRGWDKRWVNFESLPFLFITRSLTSICLIFKDKLVHPWGTQEGELKPIPIVFNKAHTLESGRRTPQSCFLMTNQFNFFIFSLTPCDSTRWAKFQHPACILTFDNNYFPLKLPHRIPRHTSSKPTQNISKHTAHWAPPSASSSILDQPSPNHSISDIIWQEFFHVNWAFGLWGCANWAHVHGGIRAGIPQSRPQNFFFPMPPFPIHSKPPSVCIAHTSTFDFCWLFIDTIWTPMFLTVNRLTPVVWSNPLPYLQPTTW